MLTMGKLLLQQLFQLYYMQNTGLEKLLHLTKLIQLLKKERDELLLTQLILNMKLVQGIMLM
jgi:hypothetical protein